MTDSRAYIVILNWNGWKDTLECLESVFKQDYPNYFVIVLDNDSSDGSFEHIANWMDGRGADAVQSIPVLGHLSFPGIKKPVSGLKCQSIDELPLNSADYFSMALVKTGGNLGFAGGNNVGLNWIRKHEKNANTWVWLLNNDTVIEPDALSQMVRHLQEKQKNGKYTCGSLVKFYQEPHIIQALGGATFNSYTGVGSQTLGRFLDDKATIDHESVASQMDYITGCSWLLPLAFIREVGLMEDRYFLYYEEMDWVLRSRQHGYQLTYAPQSVVYHKEGSSIGSKTMNRAPSQLSEFYMARNKIYFIRKFYPLRLPLIFGVIFLQAMNRIRQKQFNNAAILLKVLFGKRRFK